MDAKGGSEEHFMVSNRAHICMVNVRIRCDPENKGKLNISMMRKHNTCHTSAPQKPWISDTLKASHAAHQARKASMPNDNVRPFWPAS